MNYKMPALILCFFILTLSSEESSGARFHTAGDLHEMCSEPKSSEDYQMLTAECRGYILSLVDTWLTASENFEEVPKVFCIPEEVESGQIQAIITKYLTEHPERWHYAATSVVLPDLAEAFPCE